MVVSAKSMQALACYWAGSSLFARPHVHYPVQDLSPVYAGALLGLSNTAGALPGILGVTSVGLLLDRTSSWGASLFYPTAACQLIGLVVYTTLASSKRQGWCGEPDSS